MGTSQHQKVCPEIERGMVTGDDGTLLGLIRNVGLRVMFGLEDIKATDSRRSAASLEIAAIYNNDLTDG